VRSPRALLPHGLESRVWAFSSHGTDATEPLTSLSRPRPSSRLTRLRERCNLAARPSLRRVGAGRKMMRPPRPSFTPSRESRRFVMTGMPSAGRDSSQDSVAITAPIPRPQHRVDDVATAEWRSLATLSLTPILPALTVRPTCDSSFRFKPPPVVSPTDEIQKLDPCSLDPDRSFWSAYAELIRGQTPPTDFCNYHYVRATKPELVGTSQGTEASTSFLLLSCPAGFLAEVRTCGEPRSARS